MAFAAILAAGTAAFSALQAAGGLFGGKDRSAKKQAGIERISASTAERGARQFEGYLQELDTKLAQATTLQQVNAATAEWETKYPAWKQGEIDRLALFYRSVAGAMPYAKRIFVYSDPVNDQAVAVATAMATERAAQIEAPRMAMQAAEAEIASAELLADRIAAAQGDDGPGTGTVAVAAIAALVLYYMTKKPKRRRRKRHA